MESFCSFSSPLCPLCDCKRVPTVSASPSTFRDPAFLPPSDQLPKGISLRIRNLVGLGNLSKACSLLTQSPPVPPSSEVFNKLKLKHPSRPLEPSQPAPLPFDLSDSAFDCALIKDSWLVALRSAPSGSSSGPFGWKTEWFKILLSGNASFATLASAGLGSFFDTCALVVNGTCSPEVVRFILGSARLIAVRKSSSNHDVLDESLSSCFDLDVRPIAISCPLRRLISRALVQQFNSDLSRVLMPHQFGSSSWDTMTHFPKS